MKDNTTLLFVEDDFAFREAVRQFLGIYYQIHVADSLTDARKLVPQQPWDIALLDQTLPDGFGLELIADIKASRPDCAVIVLTGDSDLNSATRALSLGADDYVIKSSHVIQELLIRIPRALEKRDLLRKLSALSVIERLPSGESELTPEHFNDYMTSAERDYLGAALRICRGSAQNVAAKIGLGRSTIFKKLNQLGVDRRETMT